MTEDHERSLPTADEIIEGLGEVALGHQLPDGSLNPKLEVNEIRGKLWTISSGLFVLQDEGRVEEAVNILKRRFPDKLDFMKQEMKRVRPFKSYLGLFDQ